MLSSSLLNSGRRLMARRLAHVLSPRPAPKSFSTPPALAPKVNNGNKSSLLKRGIQGTALVSGGIATYCYTSDEGAWRYLVVLSALVPMFVDYQRVSFQTSSLSETEQQKAFDEYHAKWADEPLRVCLELRGFYVKMGQVMSGQPDMLPQPYVDSLKVLQEDVPPHPFSSIKKIVEDELQQPLEAVYSSFDPSALGAASIGQVHLATLKSTGEQVIVKVQYPETERFFRMDFEVIKKIFGFTSADMVPVLEEMEGCFAQEFNYLLEADNLRMMIEKVGPHFPNVQFPAPIPAACTKRVLTMDVVPGRSITKIGKDMMVDVAKSKGMTVKEFEADMRAMIKDPERYEEMMKSVPTPLQLRLYRAYLMTFNAVAPLLRLSPKTVPPNAPKLMKDLYEVHGHQIFQTGFWNADPHAGNVMLDENTGKMGLIDYGQLIEGSYDDRIMMARLIVAGDKRDMETVAKCYAKAGASIWSLNDGAPTEKNVNRGEVCMSLMDLHFGGSTGMERALTFWGCSNIADLQGRLGELMKFEGANPQYMMVQRCSFCLQGVSAGIGMPGINALPLLRPAAEKFLKDNNLTDEWQPGDVHVNFKRRNSRVVRD